MQSDIDFVIPWVDGSDPEWQKQKAMYQTDEAKASVYATAGRYRDWGLLPYWFRAAEKYAPWVRKIHFITCGQVPEWLNLNHPKLHFVKHEDYIPHKWLPTFSSHPIELNMHRIEGLSEKFVYFNDDVFLNAPVKPEDFFVDGLPCECAGFNPGPSGAVTEGIGHIAINDLIVIVKNFDFRKSFMKNITKFLRLRYGTVLLQTLYMLPAWWASNSCRGFRSNHTANSYLKSTFTEVWEKAGYYCERTSSHKFRDNSDINQWIMEYWQIMSGKFHPRRASFTALYHIARMGGENNKHLAKLLDDIINHRHGIICINDAGEAEAEVYENLFRTLSVKILDAYGKVLPEKSSFEL